MIQDNTNYFNPNTFVGSNADVENTIDKFNYNSFYRAYVVDNQDTEKLGRVKIRIPALHEHSTTYPWAYPATLTGFGFQTGMFITPPVGSLVWVTFEYSDEHRPIYFGGIPTRYAEDKYQNYGPFIYDNELVRVTGDDLPIEFTGTQQIIYKSPKSSILYFDSSDLNNLIVLKNVFGAGLEVASTYNAETEAYDRYTKLIHNDENYIKVQDGEFHLVLNGEDIVFEPGTFNNYNQLTNKPQINGVTLTGNKSWDDLGLPDIPPAMTILSYGHSTWNDFITAYNSKSIVYCRASSNSNPGTGSQTRLAFMAYVNNEENPTQVEFQYYRSVSTHSITQQGDQVYVYLLKNNNTWSVTTRETMANIDASGGLTRSYSGNKLTISGANKQDTLVSGTNIKTINNESILGSGNISAGDKTFLFTQNTATNTWVIQHNLNKYPAVTVMDSSGNVVTGDITYDDENQVTITFKGGFKGKATLN